MFGYDDDISRDHDFGPGFCIWLCKEDYDKIGADMQKAYSLMAQSFKGFPARQVSPRGQNRVGVFEISAFYRQFIGNEQPPQSLMRWLYLPEHKITNAVNGEVFEDNLGQFTQIRKTLAEYYPEDVRIKKIAARAASMAQSGQYNYARCMRRKDTFAANLALGEFYESAISMTYLLNRQYSPYYKWQFYGLKKSLSAQKDIDNPTAKRLNYILNLLKELTVTCDQSIAWEHFTNPYVNSLDRKVVLIEKICQTVIEELKYQNLTFGDNDFLEAHTWNIMNCIKDPEIKSCHITEG